MARAVLPRTPISTVSPPLSAHPKSTTAAEAARRLWERAAGDTNTPEGIAAAAERTSAELRAGLARWIGAEGYRTLLDRALVLVRPEHPALGGLPDFGGDGVAATAAVRAHGAREVAAGLEALVATVIELLGRIIGEEMAVRLVEEIGQTDPARRGERRERGRPG
jgi:hypothetical protein